ncbi:MAG: SUMF1/EgtB/PvdO family nonheme iron enzyme [Pirellulaceae bacterium]|nr:SUMF1/EgtB/PvdO family nonheme iron enzyme [Pirellulaceae bacterium]
MQSHFSLASLLALALTFGWPLCAVSQAADKHALLVGVTKYKHQAMNDKPLDFPEDDAQAIKGQLEASGYRVTTLLGFQATKQAVQDAMKKIAGQGAADGVLILGFFGHGVQYGTAAYYCPYDSTVREVKDADGKTLRDRSGKLMLEPDPASLVPMAEMLDALTLSGAGNKLLLADCCRDDPSAARSVRNRAFGSSLRVDQLPKNCAAMFACSEGEQALEHNSWKHGAFTRAILDALSSTPRVTANGLSESVFYGVKGLVQPMGRKQNVNSLLAGGVIDLQLNPDRPLNVSLGMKRDIQPNNPTPPPSEPQSQSPTLTSRSTGMQLVLIPAGTFLMGSPDSDSEANGDEKPQHRVTLSRSYYMGETEVTQGQWKAVMGTEPWKDGRNVRIGANYPATYVSWDDAVEYCKRLSQSEGREYRLPTEAEWEYACRGGSTSKYSFGDSASELGRYAWFEDNTAKIGEACARIVKQKQPNQFRLYDMHGNVKEWCSDSYGENYYVSSPGTDPQGPDTRYYPVYRGGGWDSTAGVCRSAYRYGDSPAARYDFLGFRLVSVSSQ